MIVPSSLATDLNVLTLSEMNLLFSIIMLCFESQHQANYAHYSVRIMLTIITILQT